MDSSMEIEETIDYMVNNKINWIINKISNEVSKEKPENISYFCINYLRKNKNTLINKSYNQLSESEEETEFVYIEPIKNKFKNRKRKALLPTINNSILLNDFNKEENNLKNKIFEIESLKNLTNEDRFKLKSQLKIKNFQKNITIFNFNDKISDFYYILEGMVFIIILENNKEFIKKILHPGDYFNEICLIHEYKSFYKIKTKNDSKFITLNVNHYQNLIKNNTKLNDIILFNSFIKINYFKCLSKEEIHKLIDCVQIKNYKSGKLILKQGQISSNIFIIIEGYVESYKYNIKQKKLCVENIFKQKDYFNEEGFFLDEKINKSLFAKSDVKIGILSKNQYERILN